MHDSRCRLCRRLALVPSPGPASPPPRRSTPSGSRAAGHGRAPSSRSPTTPRRSTGIRPASPPARSSAWSIDRTTARGDPPATRPAAGRAGSSRSARRRSGLSYYRLRRRTAPGPLPARRPNDPAGAGARRHARHAPRRRDAGAVDRRRACAVGATLKLVRGIATLGRAAGRRPRRAARRRRRPRRDGSTTVRCRRRRDGDARPRQGGPHRPERDRAGVRQRRRRPGAEARAAGARGRRVHAVMPDWVAGGRPGPD